MMTMMMMMKTSNMSLLLLSLVALTTAADMPSTAAKAAAVDKDDRCVDWAASGECDKNPAWMVDHCGKSCAMMAYSALQDRKELSAIDSFFDLSANDINGVPVKFSEFKGEVTVVTNVASYCGYTESHYTSLVELYSQISENPVNIIAFPCNQFGQQVRCVS